MSEKPKGQIFDRYGICTNPRRNVIYDDRMTPERLTLLTALHPDGNTWHYGYEFQGGTFLTSHLVRRARYGGCATELEAQIKAFDLIRTELAIRGHAKDFITNTCLRAAKDAERDAINRFVLLKQA